MYPSYMLRYLGSGLGQMALSFGETSGSINFVRKSWAVNQLTATLKYCCQFTKQWASKTAAFVGRGVKVAGNLDESFVELDGRAKAQAVSRRTLIAE
jgi:hypothetical protein